MGVWLGLALSAAYRARAIPFLSPVSRPAFSGEGVSIVIPARNEAADLEAALRSWMEQTHRQLHIIVVNDGSDDDTGKIADRLALEDSRISVIHDPPLPAGWLGKTNAMAVGSRLVDDPWLIFADADIVFHPMMVETALATVDARSLDGLSHMPKLIARSWSEAAILVLVGPIGFFALRPDTANRPEPGGGFAAGAFIMLRTQRYRDIGGHEQIKDQVIDDVEMGRLVKREGLSFQVFLAPEMGSVRMYHGLRSLVRGLVKNISFVAGGVRGNPIRAPLVALALALFLNAPLLLLLTAAVNGDAIWLPLTAFVLPAVITLGAKRTAEFDFIWTFLYPFAAWILPAATVIASYYRLRRGTVLWRAREVKIR